MVLDEWYTPARGCAYARDRLTDREMSQLRVTGRELGNPWRLETAETVESTGWTNLTGSRQPRKQPFFGGHNVKPISMYVSMSVCIYACRRPDWQTGLFFERGDGHV